MKNYWENNTATADKNLGRVLMTTIYLTALNFLLDSNTYRPATSYPKNEIKWLVNNTFISYHNSFSSATNYNDFFAQTQTTFAVHKYSKKPQIIHYDPDQSSPSAVPY